MIVLTGAAGFIGSCVLGFLNREGYRDIVIADDFSVPDKKVNWHNKTFSEKVDRSELFSWIDRHENRIQIIIHLGARTDTTEFDHRIFDALNLHYSQEIWQRCCKYGIPLIYASSAATYGLGEHGYTDSHEVVSHLRPLNPYGESKNNFDKWALAQADKPFFWAGLKFFNVYGPNEYHKGRMASVILHAFRQIKEHGKVKLFRSHNPEYRDGEQLRDFVYVMDVVRICKFLMENRPESGLYNLGTGQARTFLDLTQATFKAMELEPDIDFMDTPADIRDKYQYFTEADMGKLRSAGYSTPFTSLEDGVHDYVQHYLMNNLVY
ncbi:MAG: ADP-glyceromanno-heptose 6-epimerase [Cryomorphaceae bacterium]|nr:MAG: ADP-glyceromanno-heptose 6-epimerase [Cryomorphaceae bacterium]